MKHKTTILCISSLFLGMVVSQGNVKASSIETPNVRIKMSNLEKNEVDQQERNALDNEELVIYNSEDVFDMEESSNESMIDDETYTEDDYSNEDNVEEEEEEEKEEEEEVELEAELWAEAYLSETDLRGAMKTNATLLLNNIPEETSSYTIHWSSDNKNVAKVDQNGVVTFKKVGTTSITCNIVTELGVKVAFECEVTTTNPKFSTSTYVITKGRKLQLKVEGTDTYDYSIDMMEASKGFF